MCGIAGIISPDHSQVSHIRLKEMTDAIRHRGPEGEAFWINDNNTAGFGHRRLAIIDLSDTGKQPMHYLDRFTITYNGEIYNYIELKEILEKKGFKFISRSDTEVILAAYAWYREKCLDHFDGMFAFAIWDRQEQTLFAARDRFGEKPFYYSWKKDAGVFIFASEMKALWKAGVPRHGNPSMLLDFLAIGNVKNPRDPAETFFSGILCLPPAHYLKLEQRSGKLISKKYYDINPRLKAENATIEEYATQFISRFNVSVTRRLRSDVAVGTSLSGGLDSSSIVEAITSLQGSATIEGLHTFSAVFPGFEKDESKFIALVCQKFHSINHPVTPSAQEMVRDFERLCYHQEEPFGSGSIYAQFRVFERAKQENITVLLDGQGADELLAGYPKYIHWYLQELLLGNGRNNFKNQLKALRSNKLPFTWNWKNHLAAWLPDLAARKLEAREKQKQKQHPFISDAFYHSHKNQQHIFKPAVRSLNDILYFNTFTSGLEELLRYADRNSMAHGRELRLPFLSHELAEFIFSLPSSAKINNGFTKYVLRMSMADRLPNDIVWRTDKVGYEPPQKQWMEEPLIRDLIHEAKKGLVSSGILKAAVLRTKVQPQDAHAADNLDWRYLVAGKVSG